MKTLEFPGVMRVMKEYQAKATSEGVDPLGYYMAPWGYADLQVLGEAIEATGSLNDAKLADYMHKTTFHTVVGDVRFGPEGEWTTSRVLQAQFHRISGHGLDQFRQAENVETILTPSKYKTGTQGQEFCSGRDRSLDGSRAILPPFEPLCLIYLW
jgi:branched-chain amino acid transport system substrate-binding protein